MDTADTGQARGLPTPPPETELGCVAYPGGAVFRLWAPGNQTVILKLYRDHQAAKADYSVPMSLDGETGVWSTDFWEEDPDGWAYEYLVTNEKGTQAVLDPYAKSMAAYQGKGNGRGAVIDMANPSAGGRTTTRIPLSHPVDAIIYEVSIRDFTISPDADVAEKPGTFLAFLEKLPYLKELGITHIQLMPVLNFYFTDETNQGYEDSGTSRGNNYNWGYDPHNYFTPEGWYASDPHDPYCRVRELRSVISAIHEHGMGVLLDVVYNHLGNPDVLDDIVPGYYFRLDHRGRYLSNSGCGNDLATSKPMVRRLIVDSVTFLVREYGVDGFRFDLMGLMDTETVLEARRKACEVADRTDLLFQGEGWKMYNGPAGTRGMDQSYMAHTDVVAVFNDELRDLLKAGGMQEDRRGFITGEDVDDYQLFLNLTGRPQRNYSAAGPGNSMAYVTAHDGLTLHDTICHNLGLDPDNEEDRREIYARLKLANFLILTGQSIPFLHGGQERGRTKPKLNSVAEVLGDFVRNSYDSSDNINQFLWKLDDRRSDLLTYVKSLIAIRSQAPEFRLRTFDAIGRQCVYHDSGKPFLLTYSILGNGFRYLIAANAGMLHREIELPARGQSLVVADRRGASLDGISVPEGVLFLGKTAAIGPLTGVIIRISE